jgi:hypothetical protein
VPGTAGEFPAECELKKIDIARTTDINPQSEIVDPRLLLPPLAIG